MLKVPTTLLALLALACASLCGCAALKDPAAALVADAATRQAVFRYIDSGDTEDAKSERARHVVEAVRKVDAFLEGNPRATAAGVIDVVRAYVDWDELAPADRLLVQDILALVELSLQNKQHEGLLDPQAVVSVRRMLNTAVTAAALL